MVSNKTFDLNVTLKMREMCSFIPLMSAFMCVCVSLRVCAWGLRLLYELCVSTDVCISVCSPAGSLLLFLALPASPLIGLQRGSGLAGG